MIKDTKSPRRPVSQKFLAEQLGLSPATVSIVLTGAPSIERISPETIARVKEAAKQLHCRPDFYARSLKRRRTFTVALVMPAITDGFMVSIMAGVNRYLVGERYFYFLATHDDQQPLVDEIPRMLMERSVEGFILVNTPLQAPLPLPTVSIGRMADVKGVPQVRLDNEEGGALALQHLARLGHRKIAVIKGYPWNASAGERLIGIQRAAKEAGIEISSRSIVELGSVDKKLDLVAGYKAAQELLSRKVPFTGVIAFNDVTAIGAMRCLHDAGLHVPSDVSIIGFDDVSAASYQIPTLTTLRQPMQYMGEIAASMLLRMIDGNKGANGNNGKTHKTIPSNVRVEPELVVRESTRRIS